MINTQHFKRECSAKKEGQNKDMHRNAHIQPQMQVTVTCASSSEVTTTAAHKRARATADETWLFFLI